MHAQTPQPEKVSQLVQWGHWFTFANMLVAMLIATRYIVVDGLPESLLGILYLVLSHLGHFAMLGFLVYLIALFPVTLAFPFSRILRGYGALVATCALSMLVYDTFVYEHYSLHLSPFVFDIAFSDLMALVNVPLVAAVPLVLFSFQLVLANGIWKRLSRISRHNQGGRIALGLVGAFVLSQLVHIWADISIYRPILSQDKLYPLHYPATARGFLSRQGLADLEEVEQREREAAPTRTLEYPKAVPQCLAQDKPNILMVVVEGWRADLVNANTMPRFSALRREGLWYPNHVSGGNTYPYGLFTLLYGMLPSYAPSLSADKKSPLLIQQLAQLGYQLNVFGDDRSPTDPDFQGLWREFTVYPSAGLDNRAEVDKQTTTQVLEQLGNRDAPQFDLVTYHGPAYFSTPVGSTGIIPTVAPDRPMNYAEKVLFNQYRRSLNVLDTQLARLVSAVDDSTLVVITGSHGQSFSTDVDRRYHHKFSDGDVRVPLLILDPSASAKEIGYATSHYGVAPAFVNGVLNCHSPATDYSFGESLSHPSDKGYLILGNRKYMAIRTAKGTTVIDEHGNAKVYDPRYKRQRDANVDIKTLLAMMEESRRFQSN